MEKQTFNELGIEAEIMAILGKLNYSSPTPIQAQSIPVALKGEDIVGIAQTGTGKTLAFGIPLISKLRSGSGCALVILPTRELAIQVRDSLERISRNFNLRSTVLIGGDNINRQIRELKNSPRIIISTPGRLIDHLERKTVNLDKISVLVLDEADRMFDMGFAPQVKRIMREVPKERQTMLFSATMPEDIMRLANAYMKTPLRVEVAPAGSTTENVTHEIFFVKEGMKLSLLEMLLREHRDSVLVFSRTKFGAKKIALNLRKMGYTSTEIHSNRTLTQRMKALSGFKSGQYQVMVATDIAARGIDVKGIGLVVNYDLPSTPEDYVHRIGRTGRAENLGHAISFATPNQKYEIRNIERLIKKELPISELPELQKLEITEPERTPRPERRERPNSRRGRSNSDNSYSRQEREDNRPERKEGFFGKIQKQKKNSGWNVFYENKKRSPHSEKRTYENSKIAKNEDNELFKDKPYEAYKKKSFTEKRSSQSSGKSFGKSEQRQNGDRKRSSSTKRYSTSSHSRPPMKRSR